MSTAAPRYDTSATVFSSLRRHFADLRDMSHADGATTRADKEDVFSVSTTWLAPVAVSVLEQLDAALLEGVGTVDDSGVSRTRDGGLGRAWTLGWPAQAERGIQPVRILAVYGGGFHHPHLRGGTVGEWPFNVFDPAQAEAERGTLVAIAAAEIHNLVFEADYRIVPATTAHPSACGQGFVR